MKRLSKFIKWLSKEFGKAIVSTAATAIFAAAALFLPTVLTFARGGISYLRESHSVPGWREPLLLGLLLMAVFLVARQWILRRRLEPREFIYHSLSLEWILRKDFWGNFQHFNPSELAHHTLVSWIKGPFCPKCKRALDQIVVIRGVCPDCSTNFSDEVRRLAIDREFPFPWVLLDAVFVQAQAAARRKEIP